MTPVNRTSFTRLPKRYASAFVNTTQPGTASTASP